MFQQLLTPIGDSLGLSFVVAILPILAVLVLLGVLRRPAWQAALAGLVLALVIAVMAWNMPVGLALDSVVNGAVFALWPICPMIDGSSWSWSASASALCWKASRGSARRLRLPVRC